MKILEPILAVFVGVALMGLLILVIIGDWLYWLFWHTVGAAWIVLSVRWEFRDFGDKFTGLRLIKWMVFGK